MLIAHRGIYNELVKENSFNAIELALKSPKYMGVEFDIRETKDHKFILYHNTLYHGNLVKDTNFKDFEDVTLLESVLKIKTDKILLIEIKNRNLNLKRLIKLLNKYKRNYYLMSFDKNVLEKIKQIEPKYKCGVLNYVLNSDASYNLDFICLLDLIASNSIIESFKKRGIEVIIYGVIKVKKDLLCIVDDHKFRLNT